MEASEAIATLHDHTEGRHDITGEESQEIEWLIIRQDQEITNLRKKHAKLSTIRNIRNELIRELKAENKQLQSLVDENI